MEIGELISFYVNDLSETLDVSFRLVGDEEDQIRLDEIDLSELDTFGFNLKDKIDIDLFEDEDDFEDDLFDFEDEGIDDSEIISFLNQYYLIFPENLPETELF
jgi:hypothetical protein